MKSVKATFGWLFALHVDGLFKAVVSLAVKVQQSVVRCETDEVEICTAKGEKLIIVLLSLD